MGFTKYLADILAKEWKGQKDDNYDYKSLMKQKELEFRQTENTVVRVEKPSNLVSARQVGYKAKQGIVVARVKVRKGHGTYSRPKNKRRPKRQGQAKLTRRKSTRAMAEEKASKKYENCEVLGSYKVAEDGRSHFYEIVLADRTNPAVKNDKNMKFLAKNQQGRAERGKTKAGKVNKEENKKTKAKKRKKKNIKVKNNRTK
jgi:large subunit ribosomal protein L15e